MYNMIAKFLKEKNIEISLKRYGIDALNAMALGLFGSLIIGLILKNIGTWTGFDWLVGAGNQAQSAMGAAIGVCVAHRLSASILVIGATAVVGLSAASLGGPMGCFVAVLFAVEFGKLVDKTTKIDIIVTPLTTICIGLGISQLIGEPIQLVMNKIAEFITWSVALHPVIMGVIISVVMGVVLTLPISSAAVAISLSLSGLAAGAATVGCCAQMVGFAVMGYKENRMGGLLSIGLGTSMLQMPNIIRNWKIWLPPIITSAILGPVAILVFGMQNVPSGAGMGTSGLVGQIGTFDAMGSGWQVILAVVLLHFLFPALICWLLSVWFRKKGWIKEGDLLLR